MSTFNATHNSEERPTLRDLIDTDIDPDADVVIKSEFHFSTGNLRDELALLRTDAFEAVVFEAARETVEEIPTPTITDRIVSLPFFFLGCLYTYITPLLAAALKNDADVQYTRESDGDVIQGLPSILPSLNRDTRSRKRSGSTTS